MQVGEYLEMKAPHTAQVLIFSPRIDPHDWQISISKFLNSKKIDLTYSNGLRARGLEGPLVNRI